MKRQVINRVSSLIALMSLVSSAHAASFYIAPTGVDQPPPSGGTLANPFRTINYAKIYAVAGTTIYVRGGTHTLTTPITLTSANSGTSTLPVIYRAYPGEVPVISGGQHVTGWTLYDVAKNIYRANVGASVNTRQLYVDGRRAIRARSVDATGWTENGDGYDCPPAVATWGNLSRVEVMSREKWHSWRSPIASVTGAHAVMLQPQWDYAHYGTHTAPPVWVENAYELLDAEDEWYLNRTTGFLYYKPRAGEAPSASAVIMPLLEKLIDANALRYVQFKDLTFAHATWLKPSASGHAAHQADNQLDGSGLMPGNLHFNACSDLRFENNNFIHLGGTGLRLTKDSSRNVIFNNEFSDISGSGISLGNVDGTNTQTADNEINNNLVEKCATEFEGSIGIFICYTVRTKVTRNLVRDLSYTGISMGWGWSSGPEAARDCEVAYNRIENTIGTLLDGAGIYTLGKQQGTHIHHNYVRNVQNTSGSLYPDEGSSNQLWDYNVVDTTPRWLHIWTNSITNVTVRNNYSNEPTERNSGTDCTVQNNSFVSGQNWPPEAMAIIAEAGRRFSSWVPSATGSYSWDLAANWDTAVPNETGGYATLTNNLVGPVLIQLNQPVTLGHLTLGDADASHPFSIAAAGGSLTFDASWQNAGLTNLTGNNGDTISAPIALDVSLDVTLGANTLAFSGPVAGTCGFHLAAAPGGVLTLGGANTYTGPTQVSGGTLRLDYASHNSSKLSDTANLILAGGDIELTGGNALETVATTYLDGAARISRIGGSAVLRLGNLIRSNGATIDFSAPGIATTDTLNINGILGSWATVNFTDFATNSTNTADGLITALASLTDLTRTNSGSQVITHSPSVNTRIVEGVGATAPLTLGAPSVTINTLTQSTVGGSGPSTVNLEGGSLLVQDVLMATGAGSLTFGSATNDGYLKSADPGGNLTLRNYSTSPFTVKSAIVDGDLPGGLALLGSGSFLLTGQNTFSGPTEISGAAVQLGDSTTNGSLASQEVTNNGSLRYFLNSNLTYPGIIAGSGAFEKSGAGTLILTRAHPYSGPTTIAGGALQLGLGTAGNDGSLATSAITNQAALVFNLTQAQTFAGAISGAGSVTKSGAGALQFTGQNTFTGATLVTQGMLTISAPTGLGDTSSGTTVAYNGSTTTGGVLRLGGNCTVLENIVLTGGRTGTNILNAISSLFGNNTVAGAITLTGNGEFRIGSEGPNYMTSFNGPLSRSTASGGTLVINGSGTVVLNGVIDNNSGNLEVSGATAVMNAPGNDLGNAAIYSNGRVVLGVNNPLVASRWLHIGNDNASTSTDANAGTGTLDLAGFDQAIDFVNGSRGASTAGSELRKITNSVVASTSVFTIGSSSGSGAFDGLIEDGAGTVALVKNGTGTQILTGTQTYTGTTTVDGGVLQLGDGNWDGALASPQLANTSEVVFNVLNAVTYGGVVSGTGSFTKSGPGTLVLKQPQTYTGATSVTGGILQLGDGITDGTLASQTIGNEGTVTFNTLGSASYSGVISGGGALVKSGIGTLRLMQAHSYSGLTTIAAGTLQLGSGLTGENGAVASGSIINDGNFVFNLFENQTCAAVISGSGTLAKSGPGNLTLATANGYGGQTTINGGTLTATDSQALGGTAAGTTIAYGGAATNGGLLRLGGGVTLVENIILTGGRSGSNFSNAISPADAVSTLGGTLTLSGTSEYRFGAESGATMNFNGAIKRTLTNSGLMIIQSNTGTVNLNAPVDNNGGGIQFASGGVTVFNNAANDLGDAAVFYLGFLKLGVNNPLNTKKNLQIGLGNGSTSTDAGGATGTLDLAGCQLTVNALNGSPGMSAAAAFNRRITNSAATTAVLTVGSNNGTGTFHGVIENGAGIVSLVKTGSGIQTLQGTTDDAYTGDTTINGGTLVLVTGKDLADTAAVRINGATSKLQLPAGVTDIISALIIDTVAQASGTWGATGSGADHIDNAHFNGTGRFSVPAAVTPSDYAAWAAFYQLAGGAGGDDDQDGLTNQQEFAFGLIPNDGSSLNPITTPLNKDSGLFTYTRRKPALSGLSYTYVFSTTLSDAWTPFTPASTSSNNGDPIEEITVDAGATLLANPSLFIRVVAR